MQFIRSYSSHILHPQLYLSPNHRYPSTVSASLGVFVDTHFNKRCFSIEPTSQISTKPCFRPNQAPPTRFSASLGNIPYPLFRISPNQSCINNGLMNLSYRGFGLPNCVNGVAGFRAYSSIGSDGSGGDGSDALKKAWQNVVDVADFTGKKAKDASDALTPHFQQLLDSHPYLKNVIIPAGWTLTGTVLVWFVMPRVLRNIHSYSMQGLSTLLYKNLPEEQFPYEKSVWGSLEDPLRYLITFMAFSQLGAMIAPTIIAPAYVAQAWRGAAVLSFVWFIHRWKTNVFSRALSTKNVIGLDQERMLALDKISSVGIFVFGLMALAEACGVAVHSILTVGGIGGIATALAARDILGNVLTGFFMQLSRPFSLGDTIKAGSIEGQVVEMGLTTTKILTAEKVPVVVPNSLFSSQAIANSSQAECRAMVTTLPIRSDMLEKVSQITDDIKSMLQANSKIFLGKEVPYCVLSGIQSSYAELTVGCNLKKMSKGELYSAKQDILRQAYAIIKEHGASLGVNN